jgi:hypothetical protein
MDRLPDVERYSYFGSFRSDISNVGVNAAMLTEKGSLTDIGAWYIGKSAQGNIPDESKTLAKKKKSGAGRVSGSGLLIGGVLALMVRGWIL